MTDNGGVKGTCAGCGCKVIARGTGVSSALLGNVYCSAKCFTAALLSERGA